MGAWGHGSFENDDASGWVSEFDADGVGAVVSALEHVSQLGEDEYLEAPEASVAIAAAEMVASARDGDLSGLSFEDDRKAFSKHQHALTGSHLVELARRAIERILRQSELKDLWRDGVEPDRQSWFKGMDKLFSRVDRVPAGGVRAAVMA
jgi:Domain of unknown function (DUF4259)